MEPVRRYKNQVKRIRRKRKKLKKRRNSLDVVVQFIDMLLF